MKILMVILMVFVTSCGKKFKVVKPAEPEAYNYAFENKDCSTGEHNFYTLDEICKTLLDESKNNNCAKEKREKLYKLNCTGQFNV